ncbi:unnamed protein product [Phytomonas sp. EM1]|nr:unnamed protein product [Phytomonas sp. EM1]|eukprot:CCW65106.1 unnamed protein product [Phytomonas sp. isolate EM1]
MYKKALNAFFLKVHPDFFHHNREQQIVNENAVAQLNELLSWAREFKAGTLRAPPATSIAFSFYSRLEGVDTMGIDAVPREGEGGSSQGSSASGGRDGRSSLTDRRQWDSSKVEHPGAAVVNSTFELPEGFVASEANRGLVERSVNKFLRDLLRRAGCIDSITESISSAEDATAARMEAKPLRRRPLPGTRGGRHDAKKPSSLLDETAEMMSMRWSLTPIPTIEELMDGDQVLFSKALSPLQCSAALHTLRTHLGEMQYDVWESMPLIVSDRFDIGSDVTGCLTIPWDFTPTQFVSFLTHNAIRVGKCREQALAFATETESLIASLCNTLELDDVLISCSHKTARHALRLLERNKELLHQYGVVGLTLELQADRFATRANGVLIVSAAMREVGELRAWLESVHAKLPLQRKLYEVSKRLLETTMWHLKEFRNMAEPGGVDAFQSNDCTYAQRLEWAKELFSIGATLAQWDWGDFTFVLSPELDINWESRTIALPYNFDGGAFVKYVEEIQRDAKQRKRAELLKESAAQRAATEAARECAHAEELQLGELAGGVSHPDQAVDLGSSSTRTSENASKDLYRRANPHLEEYLASSDDRVDTLSVERPLSHATVFNSDAEADSQLRWEGFYESPYVDQVPTGDLDDIAHTYMATNRWHREAAAKKLIEELRSTYGSKSRRFEYQKMGDVMGINNVKVQPKGFPTLTRGLRPPGV